MAGRFGRPDLKAVVLMNIIHQIVARHHNGRCALDEPAFELFELAKRVYRVETREEFDRAVNELEAFNK